MKEPNEILTQWHANGKHSNQKDFFSMMVPAPIKKILNKVPAWVRSPDNADLFPDNLREKQIERWRYQWQGLSRIDRQAFVEELYVFYEFEKALLPLDLTPDEFEKRIRAIVKKIKV